MDRGLKSLPFLGSLSEHPARRSHVMLKDNPGKVWIRTMLVNVGKAPLKVPQIYMPARVEEAIQALWFQVKADHGAMMAKGHNQTFGMIR